MPFINQKYFAVVIAHNMVPLFSEPVSWKLFKKKKKHLLCCRHYRQGFIELVSLLDFSVQTILAAALLVCLVTKLTSGVHFAKLTIMYVSVPSPWMTSPNLRLHLSGCCVLASFGC